MASAYHLDEDGQGLKEAFLEGCRQACYTGGSGEGASFYAQAASCGRKARLNRERSLRAQAERWPLPPDPNPMAVGSIYHFLHEAWQKGDPRLEGIYQRHQNVNVAEAVHLFLGYARCHQKDLWGRVLHVEYHLPKSDAVKAQVVALYGRPVTAALDMVVDISEEHLPKIFARRPLLRHELVPGRYIIDHKTASQPGSDKPFRNGNQALWYPTVYNMQHPDAPVHGIIFDIIYKHGRRKQRIVKPDDFGAVLCFSAGARPETMAGMVKQGAFNVLQDIPNRAHCVDWLGKQCPFAGNGCDGV